MRRAPVSRRRAAAAAGVALALAVAGITTLGAALFRAPSSLSAPGAAVLPAPAQPATETAALLAMASAPPTDEPGRVRLPQDPHPHPHPITTEHERLRRERAFVARLDDALDARDAPALGRALDTYELEFPEDHQRLQHGYRIALGCLEHPTDASRLAAEQFYAQHRGSTLRRWIRRICLDG